MMQNKYWLFICALCLYASVALGGEPEIQHINVTSGSISYKLSVVGLTASSPMEYKDSEMTIFFKADNDNSIGLQIQNNLKNENLVVRFGGNQGERLDVGGKTKILMFFKLGLLNPFTDQISVEKLDTDMLLKPQEKSTLIFVGGYDLIIGEKPQLRQELLPLDKVEAKKMIGKFVTLRIPILVNNKETKRTIEFIVNDVLINDNQ